MKAHGIARCMMKKKKRRKKKDIKLNQIRNLFLCLRFVINSFHTFSWFLSLYFNIHIFSSRHKLHLPFKLNAEVDIFIIFQFIIGISYIYI